MPFFIGVYAVAVILAFPETVVHRIFSLIPMFESIHEHSPRRFLWIVSFAPAMLAGATLQSLLDRRLPHRFIPLLLVPLAVVIAAREYLVGNVLGPVSPWLVGAAMLTTALVLLLVSGDTVRRHGEAVTSAAIAGLIAVVFMAPAGRDILHTLNDPTAARSTEVAADPSRRLHSDPDTQSVIDRYLRTSDPGTAAAFLQSRRDSGEQFRYVGYAGRFYPDPRIDTRSYSSRRLWWDVSAVLVNGRAGTLQLDSIQVYNPTHLHHFARYIDTMNGAPQE